MNHKGSDYRYNEVAITSQYFPVAPCYLVPRLLPEFPHCLHMSGKIGRVESKTIHYLPHQNHQKTKKCEDAKDKLTEHSSLG